VNREIVMLLSVSSSCREHRPSFPSSAVFLSRTLSLSFSLSFSLPPSSFLPVAESRDNIVTSRDINFGNNRHGAGGTREREPPLASYRSAADDNGETVEITRSLGAKFFANRFPGGMFH